MAANFESYEGFLWSPRSGHGASRRPRWSSVCSIGRKSPAQGRGAGAFHRRV